MQLLIGCNYGYVHIIYCLWNHLVCFLVWECKFHPLIPTVVHTLCGLGCHGYLYMRMLFRCRQSISYEVACTLYTQPRRARILYIHVHVYVFIHLATPLCIVIIVPCKITGITGCTYITFIRSLDNCVATSQRQPKDPSSHGKVDGEWQSVSCCHRCTCTLYGYKDQLWSTDWLIVVFHWRIYSLLVVSPTFPSCRFVFEDQRCRLYYYNSRNDFTPQGWVQWHATPSSLT